MTDDRPQFFTVIAVESELAIKEHHLDLVEGDVLIVTEWNKVGWWWGVSAFDPTRSGWFKSTLTQPFTGELPDAGRGVIEDLAKLKSGEDATSAVIPPVPGVSHADKGPAPNYAQRVGITSRGTATLEAAQNPAKFNSNFEEDYFDERQMRGKRVKR